MTDVERQFHYWFAKIVPPLCVVLFIIRIAVEVCMRHHRF